MRAHRDTHTQRHTHTHRHMHTAVQATQKKVVDGRLFTEFEVQRPQEEECGCRANKKKAIWNLLLSLMLSISSQMRVCVCACAQRICHKSRQPIPAWPKQAARSALCFALLLRCSSLLETGQSDGKQTWAQESCLLCYIRSAQTPLHKSHSTLFRNSYVITFLVRSLKAQNIISYMCHSN